MFLFLLLCSYFYYILLVHLVVSHHRLYICRIRQLGSMSTLHCDKSRQYRAKLVVFYGIAVKKPLFKTILNKF